MIGPVCTALLRLIGWRSVYATPPVAKAVIVVYPHTSNWDFPLGILFRYATGMPIRWVGKDTLFRWPFAAMFRSLGGIPVNRRIHNGFVAQMTNEFTQQPCLYLAITPEGTRSMVPWLKSGFYRLALAAQVPLAIGFIDYSRREVGIAGYLKLSGNVDADLASLAAAYAGKHGKYPAQEGPFIFKDNDSE